MLSRIAPRAPRALVRYTSSSSSSSSSRIGIVEMAGQVEKRSVLEASVPIMWAVCGALTCMAWKRMEGRAGDEVRELLVV